ncbi:MAG: exopolysaccharide biosynthesis polyprenyl glycosylphosphotransferase [Opitutales bacterium]
MTLHRFLGYRATFSVCLLLFCAGIFSAILWSDSHLGFFRFEGRPLPWVYLIAVLTAVLSLQSALSEFLRIASTTRLLNVLRLSVHFVIIQGFLFSALYVALKDISVSRAFLLCYLVCLTIAVPIFLYIAPHVISGLLFPTRLRERAVLFVHGSPPSKLLEYIQRCPKLGINFAGYFSDEPQEGVPLPYLGRPERLFSHERASFTRILACHDGYDDASFTRVINHAERNGLRLQVYTSFANAFPDRVQIHTEGNLTFFNFQEERLENPINCLLKRWLDIAISLPVVLFILPPLSVVVALMHRRQSPGPLLYRQVRYGRDRQPFEMLKFRSMHLNLEQARQATRDDHRIFPFGAFLRASSLDEIPQFINVLLGQMSVVGPRPHYVSHDEAFEKYLPTYRSRHFVKPGITGFAQINGLRGEILSEDLLIQRVKHDIAYISKWSLLFDVYIVLKTVCQVIRPPKSAY